GASNDTASLRRSRAGVQAAEVLDDEPALVGRQTAELRPLGHRELRRRAPRGRAVGRCVAHDAGARPRLALAALVALVLLERAAGVEQTAIELLLPLRRRWIGAEPLELLRELARLLRQCVAVSGRIVVA